jgi:eukaryotic-like serine/threonine-protein kinase
MSAPPSNEPLNNRYQLVELIGRGAMGRVYKAKDLRLGGSIVAIKFLAQTLLNERMRSRFWAEASICAQLGQKSVHIIRVTDYDLDPDDVPFYAMEMLEGVGLNEIIRENPIPLARFLAVMRQICLGLHAAHEGIEVDGQLCPVIHRDIKPSNIMLMQDPSLGEFVKVLDFGISKMLQEDSGQTSTYMGTMVYSSPEQMEGRELTARSDIYSLGVMAYEMLTGELPVMAETHSFGGWLKAHMTHVPRPFAQTKVGNALPKALENLVMSCLAKEPPDRPSSVQEILQALLSLEERFRSSRELSDRIGEALNRQAKEAAQFLEDSAMPVLPPDLPPETAATPKDALQLQIVQPPPLTIEAPRKSGGVSVEDELLRGAMWPVKEVPPAQVSFPKMMRVGGQPVVTLWVMLDSYEEVKKIKLSRLYNLVYKTFLCTPTPYPLALWITAFYNHMYHQGNGPRWMPCYLDLKTKQGMDIVRLLAEKGEYQLLLFAKELPQKCAYVTTIQINAGLQANLREWVINSANWRTLGDPNEGKKTSRQILKDELNKLKPRIAKELGHQGQSQFGQ